MYLSTDYRSLMNFNIKHANEKLFGQFINNKKKKNAWRLEKKVSES